MLRLVYNNHNRPNAPSPSVVVKAKPPNEQASTTPKFPTKKSSWWDDETETNSEEDESLVIAIHREIESSRSSSFRTRLSMTETTIPDNRSSTVRFHEVVRVTEFEPIDILYHPLLYYTKWDIERMRSRYLQERDDVKENVVDETRDEANSDPST